MLKSRWEGDVEDDDVKQQVGHRRERGDEGTKRKRKQRELKEKVGRSRRKVG